MKLMNVIKPKLNKTVQLCKSIQKIHFSNLNMVDTNNKYQQLLEKAKQIGE